MDVTALLAIVLGVVAGFSVKRLLDWYLVDRAGYVMPEPGDIIIKRKTGEDIYDLLDTITPLNSDEAKTIEAVQKAVLTPEVYQTKAGSED